MSINATTLERCTGRPQCSMASLTLAGKCQFNDCYLVPSGSDSVRSRPHEHQVMSWGELPAGEKFEDTIKCVDDCEDFFDTVNSFLSWMAYLVVPIVTIVIIVGAIQLSLAGDNPEGTKKAKARITQAVVALVFYILLWSFLRWLLP